MEQAATLLRDALSENLAPLESVVCTDELTRRPLRPPDYEKENRTLVSLAQALADSPRTILQTLADTLLTTFNAGSAGVSLLATDEKRFYWPAIAGEWKAHRGGGSPRDFSPCGDVLDRNAPLLFHHPEKRYPYFLPVTPLIEECLLVPFYVGGKAVGTVWAIAHDNRLRFDTEDLRQMVSLSKCAASAYQVEAFLDAAEHRGAALRQRHRELAHHLIALEKANTELEATRQATLRLMEEAVFAHQAMEALNVELSASDNRYRSLFESIDEGFCIIEKNTGPGEPLDFQYVSANPAFAQQSGLHDVVGKTLSQVIPGEHDEWCRIYDAVLSGEAIRFEHEILSLGRVFELYAFPVHDQKQRQVAVIFKDITERRRVDSDLRKAWAAAEKANLAKSEFLSNMSHELRSPLNAILGFAQLLESDAAPQTINQRENTGYILRAGWYLLDLINEILDLALVESGKLSLSPEPVSLVDVMLECRSMVEAQAHKKLIVLNFPKFIAPLYVHADRTRMKQVLVNLLSNAIKYNKVGGTVAVACTDVSPECIRVSVKDTGTGISPEKIAQLFQPFNRLGKEAGGEEGTGIGLVMTKRLIELMSGSIGVESDAGVGSVFWIELLRADDPNLITSTNKGAQLQTDDVVPDASVRTVLYVEDNPANLKLVEQFIARRANTQLLSATNAMLGIELARRHRPAVILMDIGLPGVSGISALKILREDPLTRHIPVVAVSADAMPHDIERGIAAGFFRYITKPIRLDEFRETMDVAMNSARATIDN